MSNPISDQRQGLFIPFPFWGGSNDPLQGFGTTLHHPEGSHRPLCGGGAGGSDRGLGLGEACEAKPNLRSPTSWGSMQSASPDITIQIHCWVKLFVRTLVTRMFRSSIWKVPSNKVRRELAAVDYSVCGSLLSEEIVPAVLSHMHLWVVYIFTVCACHSSNLSMCVSLSLSLSFSLWYSMVYLKYVRT